MTASAHWRKSSHSGANEGECVKVADLDEGIGVRDSKNPGAGHLALTRQGFAALLTHMTSQP
ncbi:DUF397 domain-containing protein [Actinomadura violacea]|uniref:DUF397 domain-containing protein n=1 Tax=Actinomadura violacea TaxID=2819934 RepID=A0ABS3RRH3_9ACTN|nr:DUF397 domain-containing protein [Actinomadura violacea]MBO2459313.1 DUF397 domain-containing protein [Actinomadura violacea]